MSSHFKATPKHLLPILLSIVAASLLSTLIHLTRVEVEPVTVFPETPLGVTLNMSIFIILIASMATLIYILIRYRRHNLVNILIKASLITALFVLLQWYLALWTGDPSPINLRPETLSSSLVLTVILSAALFKGGSRTRVVAASLVGALTGTFLGASIPAFSSLLLLAILSVYDFISVYKGPIGKIVETADLEKFMGAVVTYGEVTIGMGDLVFYSMLVATVRINLGVLPYVAAVIGVFIGAYGSLRILEKKDVFPGLPFSLLLGLALSILVSSLPL